LFVFFIIGILLGQISVYGIIIGRRIENINMRLFTELKEKNFAELILGLTKKTAASKINRSSRIIRRFFLIVFMTNNIYLFWLAFSINWTPLGITLWLVEFLTWLHVLFLFFNHSSQKISLASTTKLNSSVDIFIPAVNEPLDMVEETVLAAKNINHLNKKIFLLDDSDNNLYKQLANSHSIEYLSRIKRVNAKAGNLNFALKKTTGDFVLVLDADQVPKKDILNDCLGYFIDKQIGFVTTRQSFKVPDHDFNHDHLFYRSMQPGANKDGCAFSCGSGIIYRRSALDTIGGFEEWNMVEDLSTSISLNNKKFKSIYIDKPYTLGTAPTDLPGIYKQRGTWALDSMRVFFRQNPLFKKGLSVRQKLHYLSVCYAYLVSGMILPILYLIPVYSLFTNQALVDVSSSLYYAAIRLPAFLALMSMYYFLCRGFQNAQYWAGLFPVYFKAIVLSILPLKIKYKVTIKTNQPQKTNVQLVVYQLSLILLYVVAVAWHIYQYSFSFLLFVSLVWMAITIYWFLPIILQGFNKQDLLYQLSLKFVRAYRISREFLRLQKTVKLREESDI
jgi:cellulose synthase (UDP-forming)